MRLGANPGSSPLEPGVRIDRYELLTKIGQGGMAAVWLARTEDDAEGFFALKTILPEHLGDDVLRKMMMDEASLAMAIRHPNVARTYEVGELWDMPYLVLEYVAGESLDHLCKVLEAEPAPLPPAVAVRLVVDTCAGLHAAHELTGEGGKSLELVHRDLSTHNILVDTEGRVKLIDFGIAKANERLTKTKTGLTKGKIPYMAPEQALGAPVDRRSDLWSLGAVLYVLLTGTAPFDGAHDGERLMGKLSGDPPEPLPDSVPVALRAVIAKTLAFARDDRHATAAELADALSASVTPASRADVVAYFQDTLGSSIRRRRRVIDRALEAADARARTREFLSQRGIPSSSRRSAAPPASPDSSNRLPRVVVDRSSEPTLAELPSASPPGPAWRRYVTVAVIGVLVVSAYLLGGMEGRRAVKGARPAAASSGR